MNIFLEANKVHYYYYLCYDITSLVFLWLHANKISSSVFYVWSPDMFILCVYQNFIHALLIRLCQIKHYHTIPQRTSIYTIIALIAILSTNDVQHTYVGYGIVIIVNFYCCGHISSKYSRACIKCMCIVMSLYI